MRIILGLVLSSLIGLTSAEGECPSTVSVDITSSGYHGGFSLELRSGARPGSQLVAVQSLPGPGSVSFSEVCPGRYFIAFGPADSEEVSVTEDFQVMFDGESFSNPSITVYYSRSMEAGSRELGKEKRSGL